MANKLYEESAIQNIADAIRGKNGSQDTYTVSQMATAIDNLPSGGGSDSDYIYDNYQLTGNNNSNNITWKNMYKKAIIGYTRGTNMANALYGFRGEEIEFKSTIDTSTATSFYYCFAYLENIKSIKGLQYLNTSSCSNFGSMFVGLAQSTTKMDKLDLTTFNTSSATEINNMFANANVDEIDITGWNTTNVNNMSSMFSNCKATKITGLENIDTSNVTNMSSMFSSARIETLPIIDCSSVVNISYVFNVNTTITNFGGFKDIGKGYLTTASADYSNYNVNLNSANNLTHDSLMNVINNLYDIGSAGIQPQRLTLGSTNLAKLTSDEIAIATNKGWVVS